MRWKLDQRKRHELGVDIYSNQSSSLWIVAAFLYSFVILTGVSSLSLCLVSELNSCTGVYNSWLLDDQSVVFKTHDVATRVSEGDLVNLIGVEPNFLLSALEYGCCKTFLKLKGNCHGKKD